MSEFDDWFKDYEDKFEINAEILCKDAFQAGQQSQQAKIDELQARVPEGYKLVPCNPTEEMWGGLTRHLVKYMQSHDRYCPKTLGKYINRFIGFKNIPDWLNKEIPDWESDHAFATADLGVFIYKAMIEAAEK